MANFGLPDGYVAIEETPLIVDDGLYEKHIIHVEGHHPELQHRFCGIKYLNGIGPLLTELTMKYSASKKGTHATPPMIDEEE